MTFYLFPDNICIFISHESLEQIETTLTNAVNKISSWLKAKKLTLNVKKSNLVLFSIGKNHKNKESIKLTISNEELEQKDYAKYLGIYIDKNLSCRKQIENTTHKLNRGIGIWRKLRLFPQEMESKICPIPS